MSITTEQLLSFIKDGNKIYKNEKAKESIDYLVNNLNDFIKGMEDIYGTPDYPSVNDEKQYSIPITEKDNFHLGFDADEERKGFSLC